MVRQAIVDDIDRMVELSDMRLTQYAQYSPVFWRKAEGAAQKQKPFFSWQFERENNIILIAEDSGSVQGFIIATVVDAPPVYDPGGKTCMVDDFMVAAPDLWKSVGRDLLAEAASRAKVFGAVQTVVICGHLDEPKRQMLRNCGSSIASEWYVGAIE